MDKAQEVRHRWRIAHERKAITHLTHQEILDDVSFLQKRIDELERDLADALNPVSSRMGTLVHLENGVLYYRVNGMFIPLHAIVAGLKLLHDLQKSGQKLSKGMEKEQEEMFKYLDQAFKEII